MNTYESNSKRGISIRSLLIISFLIPVLLLAIYASKAFLSVLDVYSDTKITEQSHIALEQWDETENALLKHLFNGLGLIRTEDPSAEAIDAFVNDHERLFTSLHTMAENLPKAQDIKANAITDHAFVDHAIGVWKAISESIANHQPVTPAQWIDITTALRESIQDVRLILLSPKGKESYIQYQQLVVQPIITALYGLVIDEALILDEALATNAIDQAMFDRIKTIDAQREREKTRFAIAMAHVANQPATRFDAMQMLTRVMQQHDELIHHLNYVLTHSPVNPSVVAQDIISITDWYSVREKLLAGIQAMEAELSQPLKSAIITHQSYAKSMLALTAGGGAIILLSLLLLFINLRQRVLMPIRKLTDLMGMMSRNEYVAEPPSHHFNDEISQMFEMLGKFQSNIEIIEDQKEDIRLAMQKAEESTRMKSEFLASMSHEIRTPLNGVIGTANLLLDTELKHDQRSYAQTVVSSANSLLQLVNDILDLSKIEAGKLELESIPFDLRRTVEEVGDLMAVKAYEKQMELLLRYAPDAPRHVIGDPSRIRQIFLNLCNNALKFTEKGHVVINVETRRMTKGKALFYVSIEDTGIGIAEDKLGKIFEKFSQADGSMSRKYGGTGLGLTICQQLIALMHGDIGVTSTVDVGSTFWVTMELGIDAAHGADPIDYGINDLRVLIVDDNPRAITIDREALTAHGVEVESATDALSGYDAMSAAASEGKPFDVAVIDYIMPETDGVDLARMIERNTDLSNMILVMTTSSPSRGDDQRVQSLGFEGYLTKHASGLYLPAALSRIWKAHASDQSITLVTQHNLRERLDRRKSGEDETRYDGVWVLLVEDNPVNQMVASKTLGKYGLHVVAANDGAEAIEQFRTREFHVVFMDCQMPVMDGFEATQGIREYEQQTNAKRTPIIAFTANTMKGDEEKCRASGMDDFISKPFQPEDLKAKLVKWLGEADSELDSSAA